MRGIAILILTVGVGLSWPTDGQAEDYVGFCFDSSNTDDWFAGSFSACTSSGGVSGFALIPACPEGEVALLYPYGVTFTGEAFLCWDPQETGGVASLTEMTVEQGQELAGAIILLWAGAWGARQVIRMVRSR